MNKKQYLSPTFKVIDIRTANLLTPSETPGEQVSGKSASGASQLSRGRSVWDDDDE